MQGSEDVVALERTPLEGVPGIRAAAFRLLYRFLIRLQPWREKQRRLRILEEQTLARQRRWDREHASPRADRVTSVLLFFVIGLCAVVFASRFLAIKGQEAGRITPTERTRIAIHQA